MEQPTVVSVAETALVDPAQDRAGARMKGPNMARGGVNSLFKKKFYKLTRARG